MSARDLWDIIRQNTFGTTLVDKAHKADDKIKELSEELAEQKKKISSLENQLKYLIQHQNDQNNREVLDNSLLCVLFFLLIFVYTYKVKKKTTWKSIISDGVNSFSGHGIPHLVDNQGLFITVLWSLFILASMIGCYLFILHSTSEFYEFKVITNIRIEPAYALTFPALTICDDRQKDFFSSMKNNFFECQFGGQNISIQEYITELNVKDEYPDYMNCIQINGADLPEGKNKILTTVKYGYTGGLNCYIFFPNSSDKSMFYHVSDNYVVPVWNDFNKVMKSGLVNYITISKTFQEALSEPYSKCIRNDQINKDLIYFEPNKTYQKANCVDLCHGAKANECNSRFSYETGEYELIDEDCLQNLRRICFEKCPDECEIITYGIEENFQSIDENYHTDIVYFYNRSNFSHTEEAFDEFKRRFLHLYIYFKDLKTLKIDQIPKMSITNLISDIGGTLGLFMGLSLLSSIDILVVALKIISLKI